MTIPEFLTDLLARKKMSERQLAMYLGVSGTAVNAWHRGLRSPDPEPCQKLADFAGLDRDVVMEMAGHLRTDEARPAPEYDPDVLAALRRLTPDEQRRAALPAIELAETLLRAARPEAEG